MTPPSTNPINLSMREGVFPKAWTKAVVTPLYKSRDSNYCRVQNLRMPNMGL